MTEDGNDLTSEEIHRINQGFGDVEPPEMEASVLGRLEREGLLRPAEDRPLQQRTWHTGWRIGFQMAAGLVLFAAGVGVGRANDAPTDPATAEAPFVLLLHAADAAPAIGTAAEAEVVERYRAWGARASAAGEVSGLRLTDRVEFLAPSGASGPAGPGVVGFFTVAVDSWEEAVVLAETHPHRAEGGWVEVRRVAPLEGG